MKNVQLFNTPAATIEVFDTDGASVADLAEFLDGAPWVLTGPGPQGEETGQLVITRIDVPSSQVFFVPGDYLVKVDGDIHNAFTKSNFGSLILKALTTDDSGW
jgi:hypothetical protein